MNLTFSPSRFSLKMSSYICLIKSWWQTTYTKGLLLQLPNFPPKLLGLPSPQGCHQQASTFPQILFSQDPRDDKPLFLPFLRRGASSEKSTLPMQWCWWWPTCVMSSWFWETMVSMLTRWTRRWGKWRSTPRIKRLESSFPINLSKIKTGMSKF